MNHIFVDFEMNPIEKKHKEARQICTQEIIEIGAVMLDANYEEISAFKCYVKPEYSTEITRKCMEITGITTEMLQMASTFSEALLDFVIWCMDQGEDFEIYAWSENDLLQLTGEMRLKEVEPMDEVAYIVEHWHDFQKTFCDLLGLYRPISLETAVGSIGKKFVGQIHDALWDARNTAHIYSLSKDTETFYAVMKPIMELLQPREEFTCMLGDLFNLNELIYVDDCERTVG